jgi:hypothetical protein
MGWQSRLPKDPAPGVIGPGQPQHLVECKGSPLTLPLLRQIHQQSGQTDRRMGLACPACRRYDSFGVAILLDHGVLVVTCTCGNPTGVFALSSFPPEEQPPP